jgi:hypothetical protein
MLESAGYGAAFSFYGGLNLPGNIQPFDIRRYGIEGLSYDHFRLQTAVQSALFLGTSRWSES